MLRLNLLGHTHVTQGSVVIPVSRKAAALFTYLTLEGMPRHRDHLAGLLWDTSGALLNLRVELNRLRQQGLNVFPARQSMLSLKLPTDLDLWLAGSADVQDSTVNAWLALLRGLPLGGLDDLGSSTLRTWLDHQRDHITARIEQHMGQVIGRLNRQGQTHAAASIRVRAQELGLELGIGTLSDPHPPSGPVRDHWPSQTVTVQQILHRARQEPQCLLVWGQRGSARTLISAAAVPAGWHTIQLQYTPNQDDLLHAALRHLLAPLPAAERSELEEAIVSSSSEQNLMRLATLMARQPQPVVLALHDLYEAPEWLSRMLGLLMDLSVPLLLVATPTTSNPLNGVSLANVDWARVHQLTLPPRSTESVYGQLRAAHPYSDSTQLRARATRITQLTEGWAPYVDALLDAPDLTPRLPPDLATRIRAQYGHLDPGMRRRLSVLAQLHDQVTPTLVLTLLGEDGVQTVQAGLALGILAHAAPHDHIAYPGLEHTQDDADARLVFRSEVVRIALAGALSPAERQGARQRLTRLLLASRPIMALYYAERVQDGPLIDQARAALGPTRSV
ncbi:hypothetical protein, partial [Deinococcus sp.]|uniref:hypothetical protein n=1 Tax=Deinococcus sp. TaxID=47478 RepID=UPI002869E107